MEVLASESPESPLSELEVVKKALFQMTSKELSLSSKKLGAILKKMYMMDISGDKEILRAFLSMLDLAKKKKTTRLLYYLVSKYTDATDEFIKADFFSKLHNDIVSQNVPIQTRVLQLQVYGQISKNNPRSFGHLCSMLNTCASFFKQHKKSRGDVYLIAKEVISAMRCVPCEIPPDLKDICSILYFTTVGGTLVARYSIEVIEKLYREHKQINLMKLAEHYMKKNHIILDEPIRLSGTLCVNSWLNFCKSLIAIKPKLEKKAGLDDQDEYNDVFRRKDTNWKIPSLRPESEVAKLPDPEFAWKAMRRRIAEELALYIRYEDESLDGISCTAVDALSLLPWDILSKTQISGKESIAMEIFEAFEVILGRLSKPLDRNVSLACCCLRALTKFGKVAVVNGVEMQHTPMFEKLLTHTITLANSLNPYIRNAAIIALIWFPINISSWKFHVGKEVSNPNVSHLQIEHVFLNLYLRLRETAAISTAVAYLTYDWLTIHPENIPIGLLQRIWIEIGSKGDSGKRAVLEVAFKVLVIRVVPKSRKDSLLRNRFVFWYLGEYGNFLSDEYEKDELAQDGKELDGLFLGEDVGLGGSAATQPHDLFRNILLHLERGVCFSEWELSHICLIALGKLAIRSGSAVKKHIRRFLLLQAGFPGLMTTSHMILKIIDEILLKRDEFAALSKKLETNIVLDIEEKEWVYDTHHALVRLISIFCAVPRSFLPLGPHSRQILVEMYDKHDVKQQLEEQRDEEASDEVVESSGESETFEADFDEEEPPAPPLAVIAEKKPLPPIPEAEPESVQEDSEDEGWADF